MQKHTTTDSVQNHQPGYMCFCKERGGYDDTPSQWRGEGIVSNRVSKGQKMSNWLYIVDQSEKKNGKQRMKMTRLLNHLRMHFVTFVVQKCIENERMRSPRLLVLALSNYGILKLALIHQLPLPTSPRSEALSLDGVLQKSRLMAPSTSPGANDRARFRGKRSQHFLAGCRRG